MILKLIPVVFPEIVAENNEIEGEIPHKQQIHKTEDIQTDV